MKLRLSVLCIALTLLLSSCALPVPPPTVENPVPVQADSERTDLPGRWEGAITVMETPLQVVVDFQREGETLLGTIDIPQQGAIDIPLHNITFEPPSVRFEMLGGLRLAVFEGKLEAGTISGSFLQSGVEGNFQLTAVEAVAETDEEDIERYTSPDGLFSVPVPTNWTVDEQEGYITLKAPEGELRAYLLALPGEDVQTAIDAAWEIVDPAFAGEVENTLNPPPSDGLEAITLVNYKLSEDEIFTQALGARYNNVIYVQIYQGDIPTIQRRNAQVQIIATGFKITDLEEDDLTGVTALPLTDEMLAELEAYILEKMAQLEIPGAAVAVVQDGKIVYAEGFGTRGQESADPITPDTQFMIGSTGKTMTTMLLATLVDAGLISWDTPVVEILPQFAVADAALTETLTVRNLVCACTGVPRRDLEFMFNANRLSAEDVVEDLKSYEFFTDFGEAFQYSNQMVATGGYAAGAVDGGSWGNLAEAYAQSLQQRVLDPIGMQNTTLAFDEVIAGDNYAMPHGSNLLGDLYPIPLEMEKLLVPVAPAGAHWSTVNDMARYLITELNEGVAPDGSRVVSAENLGETWQPQVSISADSSYGLGWIVDEYKGVPVFHHGGNTFGFTSDLAFLPDAGLGISVLTNGRATNLFNEAIRVRLLELVYAQEAEFDTQVNFAVETAETSLAELVANLDDVDPAAVELFLGTYDEPALGEISLRLEEETLVLDAGDFQSTLRASVGEDAKENEYVLFDMPLAGLPVKFAMDETGAPTVVLGLGAVEYTFLMQD